MQIENDYLSVNLKTFGAELVSIFDKRDNTEHLWQGNPAYWAAHAPVLFPIVGRCFDDTLSFNGEKYKMEKHGFARRCDFELKHHDTNSITLQLASNDQLKRLFSFDFVLEISYLLKENSLITTYRIENKSNIDMPFAIGGHPAFAVPFYAGEGYEDYSIEFSNDTSFSRHHISNEGLFDGRTSRVESLSNQIPLQRSLFNDDALIFKDLQSKLVSIVSKRHKKRLQLNFEGFPYLGVWAKPGADYVCLEPWIGCADSEGFQEDFTKKDKVVILPAGKEFCVAYSVSLIID